MKPDWTGIEWIPSRNVFEVRVQKGTRKKGKKNGEGYVMTRKPFPPETSPFIMQEWRQQQARLLQSAAAGTMAADVDRYFELDLTLAKRLAAARRQQLDFFCAQTIAEGTAVLTVEQLQAEAAAGHQPDERGTTIGQSPRSIVAIARIREILAKAFAAPDPETDPHVHASTSNQYRTSLIQLYEILDRDNAFAVNPIRKVKARVPPAAQLSGQDMRIVAEILRHTASKRGPSNVKTQARIAVLAWVHITPKQLTELKPDRDFHDDDQASRDDMRQGLITLTKPPRRKGRTKKLRPAETIPLTPYGVDAMRRFVAVGAAGKFSVDTLNLVFRRACAKAQAALAATGYQVDLSDMTLYHLKHSLAGAAANAAPGLIDMKGNIRVDQGLQRSLDHRSAQTTSIYIQAAIDPAVQAIHRATCRFLDETLPIPLRPVKPLRIVASR